MKHFKHLPWHFAFYLACFIILYLVVGKDASGEFRFLIDHSLIIIAIFEISRTLRLFITKYFDFKKSKAALLLSMEQNNLSDNSSEQKNGSLGIGKGLSTKQKKKIDEVAV